MNLNDKLEHKLLILKKKTIGIYHGISYLYVLFEKLKLSTDNEDARQIFVKNKLKLNDVQALLKFYEKELIVFSRYKEIILLKPASIKAALELLEDLYCRISNLTAEVQSRIIYWQQSDYNK